MSDGDVIYGDKNIRQVAGGDIVGRGWRCAGWACGGDFASLLLAHDGGSGWQIREEKR